MSAGYILHRRSNRYALYCGSLLFPTCCCSVDIHAIIYKLVGEENADRIWHFFRVVAGRWYFICAPAIDTIVQQSYIFSNVVRYPFNNPKIEPGTKDKNDECKNYFSDGTEGTFLFQL